MPKVNLTSSFGYMDPITRERRYYGPGQGVEVPQGLVDALGLDVIEESQPEVSAEPAPPVSDLPDDFPGRKYLIAAGYVTLGQVKGLHIDDLIQVKGIGTRLAEAILKEVGNG